MGQVLVFKRPRQIEYQDETQRPLAAGEVRLRTLYSGISAGTELTAYRGSNPYLHKKWDAERKLFLSAESPSQVYPLVGWGYEEIGEVIELGKDASGLHVGDRVYGAWGHRTHHILDQEYARPRLFPGQLEPILGIFSHLGSIAINGIHDAQIHIGETAAVFGLGALGQLVAQLAKQSGARVIGIDLLPKRLELASELQAVDVALDANAGRVAEQIKSLTGGRGVDVALEVTGSTVALNEAIRSAAYSARVVAMGFFQGAAQGLFLGEEFHHNRINVICSQIFGVAPELTYRWDRLRLAQTVMQLQVDGRLNLRPIITHVAPFAQAHHLFETLDQAPQEVVQAVIEFPPT